MQALDATSALPMPTFRTGSESRVKAEPSPPTRREASEDAKTPSKSVDRETFAPRSAPDVESAPTPARAEEEAATSRGQAKDEKLAEIAEALREQRSSIGTGSLRISYQEDVSRFVVQIVDRQTGDELEQIPSEELLEVTRRLGEMRGLLFDEKS